MSLPGGDETFGRKGSFAPNSSAPGEPVQLRFDQFDTAVRDPARSRGNAVAQAQRRPQPKTFSPEWWTKPKIVVAAIVVALLLILIILLPILLTLNRSTSDSAAQDSNSNSSFGFGFGNSSLDLNNLTNWNITDLLNAVLNEEANNSLFFPLLPSTRQPFTETTLTTASTTETTTPTTPESTSASTTLTTLPPDFRSDKDSNATIVVLTEKTTRPTTTPSTTTTTTTPSTTTTAVTAALAPVVHPTVKVPPVANCTGFGFRCANDPNVVIGTNKVCDGRKDCADGSDEAQCRECQTTFSCPADKDKEKGMQICLRGDVLCDGTHHCPHGQDEQLHCKSECGPSEYKCEGTNLSGTSRTVVCLPRTYLCDGDAHCKFEDDENNCNQSSCQGGSRWCEPDRRCIAKWHICDGIAHCSDGSDEKGCDCRACSGTDMALCSKDGPLGQCISRDRICDGANDCPAGEDEIDCPGFCRLEEEIVKIKCMDGREYPRRWACSGLIPECDGVCSECDSELAFACVNQKSRCIPRQQVCDHVKQCSDGSDEAPELCSCSNSNTFQCKSPAVVDGQPKCIPNIFRCDGYHHCNDGEDEADCDSCFNNPLAFHCKSKRMCFPSSSRCDGIIDCPDYSDEDDCPCHECKSQRYETYMCATKGRCLKRDYVCNSQNQYHCPGTAPEDEMFCTRRQGSHLL